TLTLWLDADGSGTVSVGDLILDQEPSSGGSATFDLGAPQRVGTTSLDLLVTASISGGATYGNQISVMLPANGLRHDARGGIDTDPTYSAIASGTTTIGGSIIPTGDVNIVMVSTRGSDGAGSKEFIALANSTNSTID